MKTSIQNKINRLIIISIVLLSFFMIMTNLFVTNFYANKTSTTVMEQTSTAQTIKINSQLKMTEQAVNNIYAISEGVRPDIEELNHKDNIEKYLKKFKQTALDIAASTEGTIAVYYRVNPELIGDGMLGFFYSKTDLESPFVETEMTDLNKYDPDDMEHVGWYYQPVLAGKPVWIEPYHNANINVEMISYIIPIYDNQKLVGVVGMDIDFAGILNIAEDLSIYNSSGAVIASMTNSQIYYNKSNALGDKIPEDLYHDLQSGEQSDGLLSHTNQNESYKISYKTLENNMKLLVYSRSSEINTQRYISITISLLIFLLVFVITLVGAIRMSKRITGPIISITKAAKRYAAGDWDVKVACDTDDELKVLTDHITIMADKTKEYIEYINNMARQDGLTNLKNKNAYNQYVEKIKEEYKDRPYAVAVFDVNNLKYMNDNYGHEKGDELLVEAGKYIAKIFSHSPVFRIGGDEFVSILDTSDLEIREELLERFVEHMYMPKNIDDPKDVCIACGLASYGEESEDYEEIFALADKRMYENKKMLKESGSAMPR